MTPKRDDQLDSDIERVITRLQGSDIDMGNFKLKPSFSWLPVLIQVVSLIAVMGWAYGALDGRLKLIEYRLAQIEQRVMNRPVTTSYVPPGS